MSKSLWVAALAAALIVTPGCRPPDNIKLEATDESAVTLASSIHAADPEAAIQLLKGFHSIEQGSWRWTMGQFALTLRPPPGAAENGATLIVKFSIPGAVSSHLKGATLTASLRESEVGRKTYTEAGEYTFTTDIPATLLRGEAATFAFSLDRHVPAGTVDARELGVIFLSASLESN